MPDSQSVRCHALVSEAHGMTSALMLKAAMKIYEGKRSYGQGSVTVDGKPLDPGFDLWVYSFDGFTWGCGGSGSMQLALALLADILDDKRQAISLCQLFEQGIVTKLPQAGWQLTSAQICEALETMRLQLRA